jgi:hypothetical protein
MSIEIKSIERKSHSREVESKVKAREKSSREWGESLPDRW